MYFRFHNGWRFVSKRKSAVLNNPTASGIFNSDGGISMTDYLPHDVVALVIELEFKAHIKGDSDKEVSILMGF